MSSGATAAAPAPTLLCRLSAPAKVAAGQPVPLDMHLHNSGSAAVDVLPWGTPFEARWSGPSVRVLRGAAEVPYRGPLVKRGDPSAAAYVHLDPGQSRSASIDLAQAFDFSVPGSYRVQPQMQLQDVVQGRANSAPRPRDQHQPMALACNSVDVEIIR